MVSDASLGEASTVIVPFEGTTTAAPSAGIPPHQLDALFQFPVAPPIQVPEV